jgi:hypothetical protein
MHTWLGKMYVSLGLACPPCSKLVNASCVMCDPSDPHPSCLYCENGVYQPPKGPWHETKFVESLLLPVVVSVASAAVIAYAISR